MKTFRFRVHGTTCASCEIILERELKKAEGVVSVKASAVNGTIVITAKDGVTLHSNTLTHLVKDHGYRIEDEAEAVSQKPASLWRAAWVLFGFWLMYVVLDWMGLLTFAPSISEGAGLWAVFGIGIIAAFSSCTAVVAGLIAAVSAASAQHQAHLSFGQRAKPHLLFQAGRLAGFALLGAAIGWLGKGISLSPEWNGLLVVAIGILMLALGMNLFGAAPAFVRPPKWLSHKIHNASTASHPFGPALLGAATFFLPCGFTQSVQLLALTSGSPSQGAALMFFFALGTMPALLGVGLATAVAKGLWLSRIGKIAGVLVILLGFFNIQNGSTLLGFSAPAASSGPGQAVPVVNQGSQTIKMKVSAYGGYEPDVLTVKKGVPVRWEVTGDRQMGCASTLVLRQFGVRQALRVGVNVIEFTPNKAGSFVFSCSMGMYRGTMIVK